MTCSICHYEWCWLCGSTYSSAHFNALNPFGCPGLQDRQRGDWGKCKIAILRIALVILFLVAIPIIIPVGLAVAGPALFLNLLWNEFYPETILKKGGIIFISVIFGVILDPLVWIGLSIYYIPKVCTRLC
jgi:hypothetical protein